MFFRCPTVCILYTQRFFEEKLVSMSFFYLSEDCKPDNWTFKLSLTLEV